METRSIVRAGTIFAAGMLAGAGALAAAPAAPRMSAQVVLNIATDELRWKRTNVRVNVDTWEPGSETGRHEHPGPALLYILEGEVEEVRNGGTRTLRPGQVVWNRGRTPHNVRNRSDRPARALAVHLDPGQ
jgi:quercetin dioxygenase-like cupin family protein